ncbi:hypothetical protein DTO039G3_2740 [Penicillium roqueforti]|nr:hypothetical protein DTO039G3_2740 [Penicillium roqueforti]
MVNACSTFLAKHPAYLRYVREVASGELVMPKYERDEDDRVIIQVGAQYCRYPGCSVSNHPFLTGNLKKHVTCHSEDLQVADGIIGRISYIEQEKVRAWYNYPFALVPDRAPASTFPSVTKSNRTSNRTSSRKTDLNFN